MQRTASPPACDSLPSTRRLPRILQQSLAWITRQLQPPGSRASHIHARSIALLIDGENTSPEMIMPILTEAGKFGMITIRRVYGKASALQSWQNVLTQYALRPIYQTPTSSTKNATDIALVIDAMDLLHTAQVDGFCLVASDSDYTPLVTRLREAGCLVVGMGKPNAPIALVRACTFFVITEPPAANQFTSPAPNGSQPPQPTVPAATRTSTRRPVLPGSHDSPLATRAAPLVSYQVALPDPAPLFLSVYDALLTTRGQVDFSIFVSECKKRYPDLVPTHYGYSRLASLIKSRIDLFRFEPGLLPGQKVVHRVEAPSVAAGGIHLEETPTIVAERARSEETPTIAAEHARLEETPTIAAEHARSEETPTIADERARSEETPTIAAERARSEEVPTIVAERARSEEAPAVPTEYVRSKKAPAVTGERARPKEAPAVTEDRARPEEAPAVTTDKVRRLLLAAWDRAPKQDGWLFASVLGTHLKQLDPKFDPKTYGYARLGLLIRAHSDLFEIRERGKSGYDVRLLSARD